jgi:hypothetical protein
MSTPIPDGFYRAKIRFRLTADPEEMIVTLGLRDNEPGERELDKAAEAIYDCWLGAFAADKCVASYALVGVDVYRGVDGGDTEQGTHNLVTQGTDTGAPPPSNCAILVKKNTAKSGRKNTGRFFIPPAYINEGSITPTGHLATENIIALQSYCNQFWAGLNDSGQPVGQPPTSFTPVILHSLKKDQPPPAAPPTDISSFSVEPMIATQRRRMRH